MDFDQLLNTQAQKPEKKQKTRTYIKPQVVVPQTQPQTDIMFQQMKKQKVKLKKMVDEKVAQVKDELKQLILPYEQLKAELDQRRQEDNDKKKIQDQSQLPKASSTQSLTPPQQQQPQQYQQLLQQLKKKK